MGANAPSFTEPTSNPRNVLLPDSAKPPPSIVTPIETLGRSAVSVMLLANRMMSPLIAATEPPGVRTSRSSASVVITQTPPGHGGGPCPNASAGDIITVDATINRHTYGEKAERICLPWFGGRKRAHLIPQEHCCGETIDRDRRWSRGRSFARRGTEGASAWTIERRRRPRPSPCWRGDRRGRSSRGQRVRR